MKAKSTQDKKIVIPLQPLMCIEPFGFVKDMTKKIWQLREMFINHLYAYVCELVQKNVLNG